MDLEAALTGLVLSILVFVGLVVFQARSGEREILKQLSPGARAESRVYCFLSRVLPVGRKADGRRGGASDDIDLAALCVQVATRLRAGGSAQDAWSKSWLLVSGDTDVAIGGSGVPEPLESLQTEGAQMVVAATRFSLATGAPLMDVLLSCASSLNRFEEAAAAQRVAFAGPRLSSRVLTALPVVGILGGEVLGAAPLAWFFSGIIPCAVGLAGVAFGVAGHVVSRRFIAGAARQQRDELWSPVLCDLTASGLRGGAAIPSVLESLGSSVNEVCYVRIARELLLGARWEEAWDPCPSGGGLLKRALHPAWEDGVSPTPLLEQVADDARRRSITQAKEVAERLSVKLAIPLGLLLLPSFVLLGLVPIVFSLIGTQTIFGVG